jgi:hypothetical protein
MPAGSTSSAGRGRLRVYLAIAPGAGKTYAMLAEAKHLAERGVDVVVGLVETHGRADTEAMLAPLEQIPRAQISHRGSIFDELDVDLSEAVDSVRRTFGLDAVAVLCEAGSGWNVESAVGATQLQHPDEADYQVQIGTGRILAIIDKRRTARDTAPLEAFLTELRLARGRALLQGIHPDHLVR